MYAQCTLTDCQHLTLVRFHIKICFLAPLSSQKAWPPGPAAPPRSRHRAVLPLGEGLDTPVLSSLCRPPIMPCCICPVPGCTCPLQTEEPWPLLSSWGLRCQSAYCCGSSLCQRWPARWNQTDEGWSLSSPPVSVSAVTWGKPLLALRPVSAEWGDHTSFMVVWAWEGSNLWSM